MKIGERDINKLIKAIFGRQHYIAFLNIILVCQNPFDFFKRYFFGTGKYPWRIKLRTPLGVIKPKTYSYYDVLTVNEIFCRKDYTTRKDDKIIVDVGSNIGISALYFLTRTPELFCYLFEPLPDNIKKLNNNLKDFKGRFELSEMAISDHDGIDKFGVEESGRYGGLKRETGKYIKVNCISINNVIKKVLEEKGRIDILKVDIEGNEIEVLNSINEKYLKKIKKIYFEIDYTVEVPADFSIFPEYFNQKRRGDMFVLKSKFFNIA